MKVGPLATITLVAAGLFGCKRPAEPAERTPAPPASVSSAGIAGTVPSALTVARDRETLRQSFVGSAACAPCHQAQATAYAKSHHALALLQPNSEHVTAKLAGATFTTPLGGTTRVVAAEGGRAVTTQAGGKTETFPLSYAAGVFPLQQLIVATERGKLQTLGASWDARPAKDGGQRWFHLYGPRGIAPADELFFTKPAQNWNHVCADCHSTLVERRYDERTDAFDTRWAELSVGCEACHGPGGEHVRRATAHVRDTKSYGQALTVTYPKRAPWLPSDTGSPTPRARDSVEIETCAPCHSRRQPLREGFVAGDPFLDAFEPELLRPGRYHADGQVEGEVYEWGSFLQSKMHASGVRCSDCHEPHSAELYAPGNALCTRCHAPARFDTQTHSHHAGAKAPACVDCHMPKQTFMQVDERRDHSIRVPRPDLSVEYGTPNACTACHAGQPATWAAERLKAWFPLVGERRHFVAALGRGRRGSLDAAQELVALTRNEQAPAIARATALEQLGHVRARETRDTLRTSLASTEPLVVYGAVLGAAALPLSEAAPLLLSVIEHPRLAVRIAAAKGLAALPLDQVPAETRAAVERAFALVEASFAVSASRPETHVERSSFELARRRPDQAEAELKAALALAPCSPEAHLNYADLERARGNDPAAERQIREALRCAPENAFAHHALGLWLVRNGKKTEAVRSLEKAVELAPDERRFRYVLAVAVADGGDVARAVTLLQTAVEKAPNDFDSLHALAGYLRKLGRQEEAADIERRLSAFRQSPGR